MNRHFWRYGAAIVMLLLLAGFWYQAGNSEQHGPQIPIVLVLGALFGVVLQRSRFCFFCMLRDLFEFGNAKPAVGLVTALLVGSVGYVVLFGNWVADPSAGYLPQDAHIGPVSWHLLIGGVLFGWGMALSGSCISAHLYRLGEGYSVAPVALAGSVTGFVLGFAAWNRLYVTTISTSSVLWLPEYGGYALWTLLYAAAGALLLVWLLVKADHSGRQGVSGDGCTPDATRSILPTTQQSDASGDCADPMYSGTHQRASGNETLRVSTIWNSVVVDRWPAWVGGVMVGTLSMIAYLRVEPLGVTAELGRHARQLGHRLDLLPDRLEGLDGFAGCSTAAAPELLTTNAVFVLALVAGSFIAALLSGSFKPVRLTWNKALKGFLGGTLLGFGAMISLGCTIGTTLSGISAFAVSGWVFTAAMVVGVWTAIRWNWHR